MKSCYGCRYLCQRGNGTNTCLHFDHDGYLQGSKLDESNPLPIYRDCFTLTSPSSE